MIEFRSAKGNEARSLRCLMVVATDQDVLGALGCDCEPSVLLDLVTKGSEARSLRCLGAVAKDQEIFRALEYVCVPTL